MAALIPRNALHNLRDRLFPRIAELELHDPQAAQELREEVGRMAGRFLYTLFFGAVLYSLGMLTWLWV